MRFATILLFSFFIGSVFSAPLGPIGNPPLSTANFDLVELVVRTYLQGHPERVYHLSYGTNKAVLPAKFMGRFKGQAPLVQSIPNGITVVSNTYVLDKATRKEAIGLCIRELRVTGNTAEVQILYFASYTGHSKRFYLVRENGKWRVKEEKMLWIACG